jgi:hypothetical protein
MPWLGCDRVVSHSCAPGYEGNPIQPGGKCRPTSEYCDHVLTETAGLGSSPSRPPNPPPQLPSPHPEIPGELPIPTHPANAFLLPPAQEIVRCDERGSLGTSGETCRCKVRVLSTPSKTRASLTVAPGRKEIPASQVPWPVGTALPEAIVLAGLLYCEGSPGCGQEH